MDLSTDPVSAFLIQISLIMSNGSNISAHIKEFSNILESRLPHGIKNSEVPCIITTDATAVTGRVGIKRSPYIQGYNVYGLDHKFNQPVTINIDVERDDRVFTSSNTKGIHINGLENFPALLESKKIARVNYVNAFILVPLIEKAFPLIQHFILPCWDDV